MHKKEQFAQAVGMFLHKKLRVTPNGLCFARIFMTPWIMIGIVETIRTGNEWWYVYTIVLYFFAVITDFFDGPLARALAQRTSGEYDYGYGGMLDRISDKVLVIGSLIPFGFDVFVSAIIVGESILMYQALFAASAKSKQATAIGKIKMGMQTFVLPLMLSTIFFPVINTYHGIEWYLGTVILFTFLSVISHYKKEVPV